MPLCPSCNATVSPWKVLRLTNFNSVTCTACKSVLIANRTRSSLIGGLGAGIGTPLLLLSFKSGVYLIALLWLGAIIFAGLYLNKLEVKRDEK